MNRPAPSSYKASNGAAYECFLGRWTERLATVFVDFVGVPADGPVPDVGCGTGVLAAEVAPSQSRSPCHRHRLVGTVLVVCTQRGTAANLAFERADVSALPFADGVFTASLAQFIVVWQVGRRSAMQSRDRTASGQLPLTSGFPLLARSSATSPRAWAAIVKSTLLRKRTNALGRFWLEADIEELAFGERGRVNEAPPDASEPHSVNIASRSSGDCGGPHLRRQQWVLRGT